MPSSFAANDLFCMVAARVRSRWSRSTSASVSHPDEEPPLSSPDAPAGASGDGAAADVGGCTTGSTRKTPGTVVAERIPSEAARTSCDAAPAAWIDAVGVDASPAASGAAMMPVRASGSISSLEENMTARSSTFSNSRTLPGHAYRCSTSIAVAESVQSGRPCLPASSAR